MDPKNSVWSFLFWQLHRSVDELYGMCEAEADITESNEAVRVLEHCAEDFRALIKRIQVERRMESAPPGLQPSQAVAWELRKKPSQRSPDILNRKINKTPATSPKRVEPGAADAEQPDDGWQVAKSRNRRKSLQSSTQNQFEHLAEQEDDSQSKRPLPCPPLEFISEAVLPLQPVRRGQLHRSVDSSLSPIDSDDDAATRRNSLSSSEGSPSTAPRTWAEVCNWRQQHRETHARLSSIERRKGSAVSLEERHAKVGAAA